MRDLGMECGVLSTEYGERRAMGSGKKVRAGTVAGHFWSGVGLGADRWAGFLVPAAPSLW